MFRRDFFAIYWNFMFVAGAYVYIGYVKCDNITQIYLYQIDPAELTEVVNKSLSGKQT